MGGDCLNTGCVPSKALIHAARLVAQARNAARSGVNFGKSEVDFAAVMTRVHEAIATVAPHDSVERYRALGVDVQRGNARIVSPWIVEVDGKPISTRAIVIASGAEPSIPTLPGLEGTAYLTSETLWQLRELPKRLVVMGGGPIGCELSQAFARLGATVVQVQKAERLLVREDDEVSAFVRARLIADGVDVRTGCKAVGVEQGSDGAALVCEADGQRVRLPYDTLLVAVGRTPRTAGFGLEELGIPAAPTVETDAWLTTLYPNIYACGDVAGPYQFTHTAAYQAWYATVNALFGQLRRFRTDYSVIPAVTFVDPEVARVGLNEREARQQGVEYEVTRYDLEDLDRAITEDQAHGFVKILTPPGKDRILGATIVGQHAGELLAEFALAMRNDLGLNKIFGTIHAYPTWAEANKYAAGIWKKTHAPQRALQWLGRYHAWRRR
jgi:pyruvate/2-oxoglutarate dehydrogenase complex dihydrolipoamide dehydrogenase (E3) component